MPLAAKWVQHVISLREVGMRSIMALAMAVLSSTAALACDIGPQLNVKLDPKDRAVLISLGKAVNAQELLKGNLSLRFFPSPRAR